MKVKVALRVAAGAVAYGLVQALLFARPPDLVLPPGESAGWFLNSGTGVLAVAAAFFALGALFAPREAVDVVAAAALIAAGGALAMLGVWFYLGFESSIFPIVWVFGIGIMGLAAATGAWLGYETRGLLARRRTAAAERQSWER